MSLQVWLPLNGNLNNQGLSDVTVTNNGATANSSGKIGSCYSFDTGKYLTVTRPAAVTKEISYSCWVNISSWNSVTYDCILSIATGTGWAASRATLCRNGSSTNLTWNIADGSSRSSVNSHTSLSLNTWYHIACTYDGSSLRIYVNGIEDASVATSLTPNYGSANLYIGSWSGDNYNLKGCLNDVRVYNHCLSAKEVKEISKGLICHYKLDNNGFGNPNLLVTQSPSSFSRQGNKYINTAADTRTNDTFNLQYYRGSTYVTTFFTKDVSTTPCDVKTTFTVPENVTGLRVKFNGESRDLELFTPGRAPVVAGETYTLSLRVLSSKSEVVGGVQVENPKLEKGSVATPWCPHESDELYYQLGICGKNLLPNSTLDRDGWENPLGSAILQDNGYYKVTFSGSTGWWGSRYAVNLEAGKTYVASCKGYGTKTQMWFWKDGPNSIGGNINSTSTPQFLYVKYTPTVSGSYYIVCYAGPNNVNYYKDVRFYECSEELDCSGLSNNGTKIGGLSSSTNPLSIRYESCYDFDGNTGSIQIPSLSTLVPSGEFTMNCWIYHDNTWSSEGYETIFGGPSGFELDAKHGGTNSPVLYACDWGKGRATYELNKWNMITMTRNTSETKFYINGELKITGSAGNIPPGSYFVGAWKTSNEQNYKGKISDFRLYSTVLSVDDIKMLYNTSASVDKNGNMYAYEFKEE